MSNLVQSAIEDYNKNESLLNLEIKFKIRDLMMQKERIEVRGYVGNPFA